MSDPGPPEHAGPPPARDAPDDPARWVDDHGDALYRFALGRLRDPDAAADAVQETFLAALRARRDFAGRSSRRTWLVGILRHKLVDRMRVDRREAPGEFADAAEADDADFDRRGRWKARPASWGADPGRALEDGEFREVFASCLAGLPPHLAAAFRLREVEGMDGQDICQALAITPTNLWARLHRARLGLRACLERNWFDRDA